MTTIIIWNPVANDVHLIIFLLTEVVIVITYIIPHMSDLVQN